VAHLSADRKAFLHRLKATVSCLVFYEINLHHLRCVAVLAEELNFGRAAARLHLSQPPLTRLVADVEKAVGATLFARTTRRVSLTPVGEVFAAEARAVLARAEEARRVVADAARRQAGQLRLAYTPLALQTVLPRLLAAFREQEHDARVDLVELPGAAQQEALAAGRVDMAFTDEPFGGAGQEEGLQRLRLHREALSLIVPAAHPLAARASVSLKEIGDGPLILHPRHEYPDYHDRILAACAASGIAPAICQREAGQNCLMLALGGMGLLLTPTLPDRFQAVGLRCLWVETPLPLFAEVWAVWPEKPASASAETLVRVTQSQGHPSSGG